MLSSTERLAEMEEAVAEASKRYESAKSRAVNEWGVTAEACSALAEYRDDVSFKRRAADPEVQAALTRDLFAEVERRGLVLEAAGGGRGMLIVRDPSIVPESEAARLALNKAKGELDRYRRERAEEIEAERKAREAAAIREAIEGDDPDAIRAAIAGPRSEPRMLRREDVLASRDI